MSPHQHKLDDVSERLREKLNAPGFKEGAELRGEILDIRPESLSRKIMAALNAAERDAGVAHAGLSLVSGALVDAATVPVGQTGREYAGAIRALTAERDNLHAEVARLTRERDDARRTALREAEQAAEKALSLQHYLADTVTAAIRALRQPPGSLDRDAP